MAKLPAVLCLDVEDPYTSRSHTATRWMLEDVSSAGLTASCFLVGEKVRNWARQGLFDVIEAVKPHDIGYHSTRHSHHPTITEISETLPPEPGGRMLWGWERHGWEDTRRILGRPIQHWGLTGGSWSPALARMLGSRGQALHYSPIWDGDKTRPCWFAGGLNFADFFGGLDATYHDDEAFSSAFEAYRGEAERRLSDGGCYLGLFLGHPTRVVHHSFWDINNFADGQITPPHKLRMPEAITASQEQNARKNVRRVIDWVASDERFEVIGFSELVTCYNAQIPAVTRKHVKALAEQVADRNAVIHTQLFTAAEIMGLMVQYLTDETAAHLTRSELMSPASLPEAMKTKKVKGDDIRTAAPAVKAQMEATGRIPATVTVGDQELHASEYFVGLGRIIAGSAEGDVIEISPADPYPVVGDRLVEKVQQRIRGWCIHPSDMDLGWIVAETRLLSWTFKPAWTREELERKRPSGC